MLENKSSFLGTEKLFPLLMKMSVPAIIGMMAAALYNVVDTIFVGRGVGPLGIAGLSIAFPIQMIVQAVGQMIGIGAASIISRKLGAKDNDQASTALGTAILSIFIFSIALVVVIAIFLRPILNIFGATDTIMPYSVSYLRTVIFGFPFIAISMAGNNMIRSEGKARTAMGTMLIGMGLNIVLDPIFIFVLDMGIEGAALATVVSQFCSFIWVAVFYLTKQSSIRLDREHLHINTAYLREMLLLGLPNAVQSAGMSILAIIINNTLGTLGGDLAISTYGMVHRLLSFIFMPMIGLAQGFQPIAGYNFGAKQFKRVRNILFLATGTSIAISSIFFFLIRSFPEVFIGLFTTDVDLIATTARTLKIMCLAMPLMTTQIVAAVYFQAIGKGVVSLILGLSRQFLILIPIVLILPRFFGVDGVWASFPSADFISITIAVIVMSFEIRRLNKFCIEQPVNI